MKVKGAWDFEGVSIPGFWIDDKQSPDGKRFEASKHGYEKLRQTHCDRENGRCTNAGNRACCRNLAPLKAGELHHTGTHGRGIGGAWRDDRYCVWVCRPCHQEEEKKRTGSRWSVEVASR